ncbi:helix-turn-helix domain-containing protein [Falsiroseomonas sp.]|uniref:helix-turn-helix domain-containing protein n=1 Tax=Falsiroseomonas sp. TaxID=2870721 RepID=UPI0035677E53
MDEGGAASVGQDGQALAGIGRRLRDLRRRRSLTLQALSEESGVSTGMLSQMERGVSAPSIRTLQRVAEALEVPIGWFFSDAPSSSGAPPWVLRRADRRRLSLGASGVTKELLAPAGDGAIELLYVTLEPGGSSGPTPYAHAGEDAGLVIEGSLRLEVDGQGCVLLAGDAFRFRSSLLHRFENAASSRTVVLWAVTPPFY